MSEEITILLASIMGFLFAFGIVAWVLSGRQILPKNKKEKIFVLGLCAAILLGIIIVFIVYQVKSP
jgi:hypothetical protein